MHPPVEVTQRFGTAVKNMRLKQKMTQQELADACGLDIGYIGQIERAQRNPTLGAMHSIASVLRINLSALMKFAKLRPTLQSLNPDSLSLMATSLGGPEYRRGLVPIVSTF